MAELGWGFGRQVQRLVVSLFAVTVVTFLIFHRAIDRIPTELVILRSRPAQLSAAVQYVADHPGGWAGAIAQFLRLIGGWGQLLVVAGVVVAVSIVGAISRLPTRGSVVAPYSDRDDGRRALLLGAAALGLCAMAVATTTLGHWATTPRLIRNRSHLPSCGRATEAVGFMEVPSLPSQVAWQCITKARLEGRPAELRVVQHYNGETLRTYYRVLGQLRGEQLTWNTERDRTTVTRQCWGPSQWYENGANDCRIGP